MSITIKHLDGPLKDEKSFGDDVQSILIGRDAKAEISYPEDCGAVKREHLQINREADGSYTIAPLDSAAVEVDGKPIETDTPVISGSIVTVGRGGPRFEVTLPGITIQHLEGPLAGTRQFFPDAVELITFGRPPAKTDIAYPGDYARVSRTHFSLRRKRLGEKDPNGVKRIAYYADDMTNYVGVGGVALDNGEAVNSGSELRLGNDDGPSFRVSIDQPAIAGVKTEQGKVVGSVRKEAQEADKKAEEAKRRLEEEKLKLEKMRKQGIAALVAVTAAVVIIAGAVTYRDWKHEESVQQLAADLAASDAQLTELAKNTIPESAKDNLRKAVYLVAQGFGDKLVGKATAWALGPNMLATNAHVTSKMSKLDDWKLIGPNGEVIPIEKVVSHPGYDAFKKYRDTVGSVTGGEFATLDVVNQYDVGIIYTAEALPPDPETKQIVTLEPASADYVKSLEPGTAVAAIGFPIEDMTGQMVVTQAPATLHFGNISSLTDVFMCKADPGHQLLIQHSVPVAGGMSGSPLIDSSGKVIGVVSGGTTATVIEDVAVRLKAPTASTGSGQGKGQPTAKVEQDTIRIPNAALVNFAQRIDLLSGIGDGTSELSDEKAYWKDAAKKFENFFENAAHNLVELAGERYDVKGGNDRQSVGTGTLEPGTSSFDADFHHWVLKPGHVYGFIADSESGAPIALSVTKSGSSQTLKDKADPRPAPVLEIAPTAWVTVEEETPVDIKVFSSVDKPADYKLYVYDWEKPVSTSATEAVAPAGQ